MTDLTPIPTELLQAELAKREVRQDADCRPATAAVPGALGREEAHAPVPLLRAGEVRE